MSGKDKSILNITMKAKKTYKKRYWIILLALIVLGGGAFFYVQSNTSDDDQDSDPYVIAEKGTVVEKALAVGNIEPENEIEVKSKISGVVSKIFAEPGEYVFEGDPLIEVRPDPTPLELAEAKRNLERTELEKENLAKELERKRVLKERNLISEQEYDQLAQQYNDVKIRVQINKERLELLETGRIMMGETLVESVIRAPVDGFILEKMVDVGEPVVPLTSYQAGTPLMSIAKMENLLFKGTVDEIDVGKMEEGMPAEIKIGALPGATVEGVVSRISLKAIQQDNATVFPVEITITETHGVTLRAGYSANADIIIRRMNDVITIPERLVRMENDRSFIEVPGNEPGSRVEKEVELGLSDAITVAVTEGLSEGERVLERPTRTLTVR